MNKRASGEENLLPVLPSEDGSAEALSRRGFFKLAGASVAMAGLAGCTRQPVESIYPYTKQPEDLIPGCPRYFATAFPFVTGAVPLLVKSDQYRPIKIDGNPDHPYNQGASDPFAQATLLELYDPDRTQHLTFHGERRAWNDFAQALRNKAMESADGRGIYILGETVTSPTLARRWKAVQSLWPRAVLVQYDPAVAGTMLERCPSYQYDFSAADVIVSLDADFLSGASYPGFHKLLREYSARRKDPAHLNRLYAIESSPTTTGLKAEHRLVLRASEIPAFAAELARAIGATHIAPPAYTWTNKQQMFLAALAKDLQAHAGSCAVLPGLYQDKSVEAAACAINSALGNWGKTVFLAGEPVNPLPSDQRSDLHALAGDLHAGKVDWLVVLNANPVYTAPAELDFAAAMAKAKTIVHLGLYADETAQHAHWRIPAAHSLESWSDARAYDGTVSIVQPLVDPFYGGKSAHDVLQCMLEEPEQSAYDAVRATWRPLLEKRGDFELQWRKALHTGWIDGTAFVRNEHSSKAVPIDAAAPPPLARNKLEIVFRPDPTVYDGRWSNVSWLQELPKPITNLSWDNAALLSFATMARYGLQNEDMVELTVDGRSLHAPVLAVPGHPDDAVTIHLGYGRSFAGRVGNGAGCNAYGLRTSRAPFHAQCSLRKVEGKWPLAITKSQTPVANLTAGGRNGEVRSLESAEALGERGIVRTETLDAYKENPDFAHEGFDRVEIDKNESLFPNWEYAENAWGMAIDMSSCTGCNACIAGCYAENNIAVVGKEQARIGRTLQWLRIDTYFEGDLAAPRAHFQPMACQHCENAPCEQVCPVSATTHSPEGLNTMVYNRCVGTRYCSNNCPYKARRFNYLLYSDFETESLKAMRNPDVTVRSRGVMEKCTFCVQRIAAARIAADKENRPIREAEVQTACQQACPASAIVFGNLNDPHSAVSILHAEARSYAVLGELNTRPRTKYVAEVTNPNRELHCKPEEQKQARG
jgi:molybdopterin-containing oxidoreductase family iron-sulfur binding subunit